MYVESVCFLCVFFSLVLDVRLVDVPARVTQEEGHKGFLIHLPSAVLAIIFIARRIQLFISLVDREVEFIVLHLDLLGVFLFWFFQRGKMPVIGPRTVSGKSCVETLVCVAVEKNPSLSGMYSLVLEIFRKHARSRLTGTST